MEIKVGPLFINQETQRVPYTAGLPVGVKIPDKDLPVAKTISSLSIGFGVHGWALVYERENREALDQLIGQVREESEKIKLAAIERLKS